MSQQQNQPNSEAVKSSEADSRWNFSVLTVDVAFFSIGMALLDVSAVLPLLLARLGASDNLIGGSAAVRMFAFNVVQIFVAYMRHGKSNHKAAVLKSAIICRVPICIIPFYILHASDSSSAKLLALWSVIIAMSLWAFGDGLGYMPWMEIIARSFSERARGRFFATTQLISGIATVAIAAIVVRWIWGLTKPAFSKELRVVGSSGCRNVRGFVDIFSALSRAEI